MNEKVISFKSEVIKTVYIMVCAASALAGYILGLLMANRIADVKIAEMRSQMGLDIETGEEIDNEDNELFKE